jgi:hypothetical protein
VEILCEPREKPYMVPQRVNILDDIRECRVILDSVKDNLRENTVLSYPKVPCKPFQKEEQAAENIFEI